MPSSPAAPVRELGLWSATALVVGHAIGVGIFLTPAQLIGALASPVLTLGLWAVCGAIVLAGAWTFGELASRYPQAGGPYIYLREGWGEQVAFLYGWQALLIMDPGVLAALTTGGSQYLVVLWPAVTGFERWIAVTTIWVLALLNMIGLTLSARVFGALTACKLLALAALIVVAFTVGDGHWSNFVSIPGARTGAPPLPEALALGLVSIFFSFAGFWEASRIAGEVREPDRTLPLAFGLGVGCLTFVYVATTSAFIFLVPAAQATSAPQFARRAGEAMLGSAGPSILAAVVVLSVIASAMALLLMAPRLYLAMSRDRLFPAAIASLDPATRAPVRATAMLAALATVFVIAGTFEQIVSFLICTAMGFIALAAAALLVVRRRAPDAGAFRAPGYPWTTVLFVLLVGGVIALVALNQPLQALVGSGIVALGWPAYGVFQRKLDFGPPDDPEIDRGRDA
jgi:basic amino acid/polyamine antiporter, APA family